MIPSRMRVGAKVMVATPEPLLQACASAWAQGGIAAALGAGDSAADHAADTMAAGAGPLERCGERIARLVGLLY